MRDFAEGKIPFNKIHVGVDAPLRGGPDLDWAASGAAPSARKSSCFLSVLNLLLQEHRLLKLAWFAFIIPLCTHACCSLSWKHVSDSKFQICTKGAARLVSPRSTRRGACGSKYRSRWGPSHMFWLYANWTPIISNSDGALHNRCLSCYWLLHARV
jgi:hypothetical protein